MINHFKLNEVENLDDYCVNGSGRTVMYLCSLDTDKLLAGFFETAGIDMNGATRYGGWENSLIGGHTMGHYLSACAMACANAGVKDEDKEILYNKITTIIDGLSECQKNSKGRPGFIFGATLTDKDNVESQFDNVELGHTDIFTQSWVPWYTMHKLIAGVTDVYKFIKYEPALTIAKGLGDWTYNRASKWDEKTHARVLETEYGGMNDALYELYKISKDKKHAEAAHFFDEESLFEKVLAGGKDVLDNRHANTTIPKFMGALNRYVALREESAPENAAQVDRYLKYAMAFWDMVIENHTYITGANSEWEHFGKDKILDAERTNCTNETCNVYNMLKLSRMLFEITGEKKYADYYENAFYNSILSSQNPKTGMTTYFQPMASGYFKVYGEPFTKFWCCTGSGMENFTKLNDSIYFRDKEEIYVNLYLSSRLLIDGGDIQLLQESDIPYSDTVRFTVHTRPGTANHMRLKLRIPSWTDPAAVLVRVNEKPATVNESGGYITITDSLSDGAVVTLTLPMRLEAHGLPDNDTVYGFTYGPIVLSADLGNEDMQETATGINVTIPANKIISTENLILPKNVSREEFIKNPSLCFEKDGDNPVFRIAQPDGELVFSPHYLRYKERYGIYWYLL